MSIRDFHGVWHSSKYLTNPLDPKWSNRVGYYPPDGLTITGARADKDAYVTPGKDPRPTSTEIVKFTVDGTHPNDPLKLLLERADYHYIGGVLISTPIVVNQAGLNFVDVVEYVPNVTVTDPDDPSLPPVVKTMMAHTLIWSDGLRTMWWCCRS